jgi:hypothetical protein
VTVAACLIVRDAAATVGRAIASVRPHVSEVNVFLAGESSDGTAAVVEAVSAAPGAPVRVEAGEFSDFASARERSFAMASRSEWILWLDADDVVEGADRLAGVLRLAGRASAVFAAYVRMFDDVAEQPRARIVRRDAGARWHGVVHEELLFPDAGIDLAVVNPWVMRWVHGRTEYGGTNLRRNRSILEADVARAKTAGEPIDVHTLLHLGRTLASLDPPAAVAWLRAYVERTDGRWCGGRLEALLWLASLLGEPRLAACAEAEKALWVEAFEAGAVDGLLRSSPAFWAEADRLFAAGRVGGGRNALCWCGSGVKLKRCCGVDVRLPAVVTTNETRWRPEVIRG